MITRNEAALIDHAVRRMQGAGVQVTPDNVEVALNAARGTDARADRQVTSTCLTPRSPDGKSGGDVIQNVRTGPKPLATFADPVPYFKLSDHRRAELEAEAAALRARIVAPGLDLIVRDKLKQDLRKIEDELLMDRGAPPDRSSSMPGRGYDRATS